MKKEINKTKTVKPRRVLQYFWQKSMTEKGFFIAITIWVIVSAITTAIVPLLYAKIIDAMWLYTGGDKTEISNVLMGILFSVIIVEIIHFIGWRTVDFSIIRLELNVMKRIFKESFDYLTHHSYKFFANSFGGSLVKKINKLVYSYENVIDIYIFDMLRLGIILPFILVAVAIANIWLGLIFLIWLIVYCFAQYFLYKWHLPFTVASNIEDSNVTWALADTITNHFNVLTFSSHKTENMRFDGIINIWRKKSRIAWKNNMLIYIFNSALMIIFEICILYFSIKFWWEDMVSTGTIVLLQIYMFRIFQQMFNIWNVFKRLYRSIWESTEMLDILNEKHEIQDIKNAKKLKINNGEIIFENVWFGYSDENIIFEKFWLKIDAWEKVALVWYSGAWKTTVVKMLFRFFDIQKGLILVDWQDISKVMQESLREQISMVPQDPILFHRSLKENISYGKPDASMEEIIEVAKKSKCHDFISQLSQKYETMVGERWIKLSGGERQRVAIARAMLEDKKILVLDEATSSLDSESEKLIQDAMENLLKWKTAIIIAHRLSTIMKMDRIIVMDQWKIIEEGSHQDLLKKSSGIYKKLREIQSGEYQF